MGPVEKGGMRDLTVREVDEGGEVHGSTWVVGNGIWSRVNMNDGKIMERYLYETHLLAGSCLFRFCARPTGSYLERETSGVDVVAREEADSRS